MAKKVRVTKRTKKSKQTKRKQMKSQKRCKTARRMRGGTRPSNVRACNEFKKKGKIGPGQLYSTIEECLQETNYNTL